MSIADKRIIERIGCSIINQSGIASKASTRNTMSILAIFLSPFFNPLKKIKKDIIETLNVTKAPKPAPALICREKIMAVTSPQINQEKT